MKRYDSFWNEYECKRGACEIATCIYMYLCSLPDHVKDVVIYSDCCSGQNQNQYLAAALLHAVQNIKSIQTITHKYRSRKWTHTDGV